MFHDSQPTDHICELTEKNPRYILCDCAGISTASSAGVLAVKRLRIAQEDILRSIRNKNERPVGKRILVPRQRRQSPGFDLGIQFLRKSEDHWILTRNAPI